MPLGQLAELTVGHVGSMASEYRSEGVPFLRSLNVKPYKLDLDGVKFVSQDFHSKLSKSALKPGDVVIVRTGKPGTCAVIPASLQNSNCSDLVIVRCGKDLRPHFLSYWINSLVSNHISSNLVGAVQQHFNVGAAKTMPVPSFDLNSQDEILGVLKALDDKIENNQRMNETLEAMAQAIFKDWFVDFGPTRRKAGAKEQGGAADPVAIMGGLISDAERASQTAALFPDHLGENSLPEGWEERPFGEMFDVVMGQSPPGSTYNEHGDGLPFFQGRRDFGFRFPEKRVFCDSPQRIAKADWTLLSVRAPVGDINRALEECCIGRGVAAFCERNHLRSYTYYSGLHLRKELSGYDKDGTVFGSINQSQLKALKIIDAGGINAEFDQIAGSFDALIRSKIEENKTLAETRDYLLPRLMSGQISAGVCEDVAA